MSALCLYDGLEALCTVNKIKLELELELVYIQSNYNMGVWISIVYGECKLFN